MFKKLVFQQLKDNKLNQIDEFTLKRDELNSFYETFDFIDLINSWPQIVGDKLSRVTSPLKIKIDSLVVLTKHSIFSQELSYLQEEIKKEIFLKFPRLKNIIKKISFFTSESYFKTIVEQETTNLLNSKKLHPMSPEYRVKKNLAEKVFTHIEDKDLKELLISLYIQSS
jgi:hypothetical protein